MRSSKSFVIACGIFLLLLGITASIPSASEAASDKPIKLSFSTIFPAAHLQGVLNQYFCDEIARRTNGRVEITLYPAGTLTSATKNFDGVIKGISDIGMSCPLYVGGPLSRQRDV